MKTQQHTLNTFHRKHNTTLKLITFQRKHNNIRVRLHHKFSNSLRLLLFYKDLQFSLASNRKVLLGCLVLHYTMRHILDPTSLLVYIEVCYQSLEILYDIPNVLYGILVWRIPRPFQNRYSLTFYGCSTTFSVMARREIMFTDIALLLEHSAMSFQYND